MGLQDVAVAGLDAVPLNVGFARAALGVGGATAWADRTEDPRAFHVAHPHGMSLVWGPDVAGAFDEVVAHLRTGRRGPEWLQVDPRWAALDWDGALGAVADGAQEAEDAEDTVVVRHGRVNFTFDPGAHRARWAGTTPPDGWHARSATAADFDWPGTVVPSGFWPDAATFLANGGGAVVERDGVVGAMAFTSFRHGDDLELGIETDPAHRRLGLAGAAAAAMLARVTAAGLTPVWACRAGNVGSYRLACSLGFVPGDPTPYWHLP